MQAAEGVALQHHHMGAIERRHARDALMWQCLVRNTDRLARLRERRLLVDVATGKLHQRVADVRDEQVLLAVGCCVRDHIDRSVHSPQVRTRPPPREGAGLEVVYGAFRALARASSWCTTD